jgi:Ring finger domain
LTLKHTRHLLYIQISISLPTNYQTTNRKNNNQSPLIASAMRALLQFTAAAASSQFPLPPASSTFIMATSTDEGQKNLTADIVIVLLPLLGTILCLVGLALMNRFNNFGEESSSNDTESSASQQHHTEIRLPFPPPPKHGLKKSALKALPKTLYDYDQQADIEKQKECVICLTEFEEGEEIRKLPQCGHEFHVGCIDQWLRSQSSCPSCRRVLVVVPPPKQGFAKGARNKADGASTFLP